MFSWKKRWLGSLALGLASLSFQAQAEEYAHYGMGGCGIGSLIFEDAEDYDVKWKQIVGVIIDSYLGVKSSALTSGTSNCAHTSGGMAANETDLFLEANQEALALDIARGSGDHLASLSKLLGCQGSSEIAPVLQNAYPNLVGESVSPVQFRQSVKQTLKSNSGVQKACPQLG